MLTANSHPELPKVVASVSKSSPKRKAPKPNFRSPTAAKVAQLALYCPIWQP